MSKKKNVKKIDLTTIKDPTFLKDLTYPELDALSVDIRDYIIDVTSRNGGHLAANLGVVDLGDSQGFVIADIPGIIEGASEGTGLGLEFLRHIERTKVLIHLIDAASTEGRDPINDIKAIHTELEKYGIDIHTKPQVIAANKIDVMTEMEQETVLELIREEMEPLGIPVYPISAVSGAGVNELLWKVNAMLKELPQEITEFEPEWNPLEINDDVTLPFEVSYDEEEDEYVVEGPRIERMLGYTNLESEKGFQFFQDFLKKKGILDELEKLGIQDGDTVRLYGLSFEYFK